MAHVDAVNVGALTAVTSCGSFYRASAGPLLQAKHPSDAPSARGWRALPPRADGEGAAIKLLAIDVEMIERVSDKLRLPVKVALVQATLGGDADATVETLLDTLVDPSAIDPSWADPAAGKRWDFKESITGLSADLLRSSVATSVALTEVQSMLAAALASGTFLVGHNIGSDLRSLHLHGLGLRRRLIDTQDLYPYEGQRRAPLRALVAKLLLLQARARQCEARLLFPVFACNAPARQCGPLVLRL